MADTTMPATEAKPADDATEVEKNSYEFAFHILPTVAEEEVTRVFDELKTYITKQGGDIFLEESPERIDLAYEIVKQSDGKNKRYGSAYFGWMRFRAEPDKISALTEDIEGNQSILRYLLIRLTKVEEARPFQYHEEKRSDKKVEVFDEEAGDVLSDPLVGGATEEKTEEKKEESSEEDKKADDSTDKEK